MKRKQPVVNVLRRDKLKEKIIDCFSVQMYETWLRDEMSETKADCAVFALEKRLRTANDVQLMDEAELVGLDVREWFDEVDWVEEDDRRDR